MGPLIADGVKGEMVGRVGTSGSVYCFRFGSDDCFKVGRTKDLPEKRKKNDSTGSPRKLTLHREVKTEDVLFLEKHIHWG